MKEAGWSAFYIALPLAFGVYVWNVHGSDRGVEYLTGYLVEKSLSVDNLFVFMLLLAAFAVPAVQPAGAALRHRRRARAARDLHRARRRRALPLGLGLPGLRGDPDRHRGQAPARRPPRPRARGRHRQRCAWSRLLRRVMPVAEDYHGTRLTVRRPGGGPHAVRPRRGRGARHRHRLRRRLGAGRLRHHRRPLPGLRDQRLRPPRPARPLLRAGGRARRASCTSATAWPRSSPSSA